MNYPTPKSRRSFLSYSLFGGCAAAAAQLSLPQRTTKTQATLDATAVVSRADDSVVYHYEHPYDWDGIMQGLFPSRDKRVNSYEIGFDELPSMRYRLTHMHEITTHHRISRGSGPALALERQPRDRMIEEITVDVGRGKSMKVKDWLRATNTIGLLVLRGNKILTEQYWHGLRPDTRITGYSLGKVLAALGIGVAVQMGKIDLNKPVQTYVPELEETGYKDATVQHLLDMESGIGYALGPQNLSKFERWAVCLYSHWLSNGMLKDSRNAPDFVRAHLAAAETKQLSVDWGEADFILSLSLAMPHGHAFYYKECDPVVVGWLIASTFKKRFSDALSEQLWSRIGAEGDAHVITDGNASNSAYVGAGMGYALRDMGRVGILISGDGRVNGEQVVSDRFVQRMKSQRPDWRTIKCNVDAFAPLDPTGLHDEYGVQYGDFVYSYPDGRVQGSGGQGQTLTVKDDVVVVKFSTLVTEGVDDNYLIDHLGAADLTKQLAS
ncbi:MAG: serine hydrolase domain-containing protein [Pirellulaceae bacterium]